jgi:hypothetical protein
MYAAALAPALHPRGHVQSSRGDAQHCVRRRRPGSSSSTRTKASGRRTTRIPAASRSWRARRRASAHSTRRASTRRSSTRALRTSTTPSSRARSSRTRATRLPPFSRRCSRARRASARRPRTSSGSCMSGAGTRRQRRGL